MGLEFLIKDGTAHYTAVQDKCDAIHKMKAPKSVKNVVRFVEWLISYQLFVKTCNSY